MRYMNFNDLREQQNSVIDQTQDVAPGVAQYIGIGTSALLVALYETSKLADLSSDAGVVQSYCWLWIYKSVYTVMASLTCAESGLYAESLSLNRSLSETLVQILYLRRFPAGLSKLPSIANNRRRGISFYKMFNEIAPGYYESSYVLSSEFLHAGLAPNVYKMQRDESGVGRVDPGIVFKADPLSHCFNELSMLLLGFLRCVPLTYPLLSMSPDTSTEWSAAISSMESVIDSHITLKGGANDWHLLSKPLWSPV